MIRLGPTIIAVYSDTHPAEMVLPLENVIDLWPKNVAHNVGYSQEHGGKAILMFERWMKVDQNIWVDISKRK